MPQTSRQRIIESLKRKGKASVGELSKTLGLTTVTIRHHLQILKEAGVISAPSKRKKAGRGRPEMVYRLSEDIHDFLPSNLGALGVNLVDALADSMQPIELRAVLRKAGAHAAVSAGISSEAPLRDRLEAMVEYLNESAYMAAWQPEDESLKVEFSNCPYYDLACRVPLLCTYDLAFLETSLALPIHLRGRIIQDDATCTFTCQAAW